MKRTVIIFCFIGIAVAVRYILYKQYYEGFQDSKPVAKSPNPQLVTYEFLTTIMKPIRRLSSVILNPANWKERVSMATMSPIELARKHLKSQVE
jgi:hypothetical protein